MGNQKWQRKYHYKHVITCSGFFGSFIYYRESVLQSYFSAISNPQARTFLLMFVLTQNI